MLRVGGILFITLSFSCSIQAAMTATPAWGSGPPYRSIRHPLDDVGRTRGRILEAVVRRDFAGKWARPGREDMTVTKTWSQACSVRRPLASILSPVLLRDQGIWTV
jgi:hypothetical protein